MLRGVTDISGNPVYTIAENRVTPILPQHPENGGHDNPDTEVGIVIAVIGHSPTPPEGGTFRHRGVTQPHTIAMPIREAKTLSLIRRLLIRIQSSKW
ncbi:hypothetical protein AVEN_66493-1 [Araneus ventricosus]|uniref:Uncharacterized protein n=1 Tax=Araneus ventricosus TaxID=182803 RepID=A0A4Y2LGL3_ARAVE|nr:hypothetical protein AVEN_66493-1 [Araneus ventricosus]